MSNIDKNFDLTIIIPSRFKVNEKVDFMHHIGQSCGASSSIVFIENDNGKSLTQVYSEALKNAKTNRVVFIHDDIEFLKNGWGYEVMKLFDENKDYGIIGVAGSAEFDEKGAWWNYKKKYGQVLHRKDGKTWLSEFSPLIKEGIKEVCVVDGLFIAVDKTRISKSFDTYFEGFNMYDIDFCLANYVDGQCKIGVTTNIRIAHNSVGELKPNWFENREKIIEKYGDYFPIKVK